MSSKTTPLIADLFHCSICFFQFDNEQRKAKLLPCHHTFCSLCLTKLVDSSLLKCPLCCEISSVLNIGTLKNNHYLIQFADVLQGITSLSVSYSDIPNSPAPEPDSLCRKHGNTEKFFWCKTCECMVCIHCMGLDHKVEKGHQVIDITEAKDDLRRKMLNTLSVINAKIAELRTKQSEANSISNSRAKLAIDAIQNATSGPSTAMLNMVTDKTLNPNNFSTKFSASSGFLNQGINKLNQSHKDLKDILGYFLSMESFVGQKLLEAKVQNESKIVMGFLHPDTHFDYGKMYCIRCGKMCQYPEICAPGKGNPYGVPVMINQCSDCGITLLEIT